MFEQLKSAWRAGRSGQLMPADADRTTGQTVAVVGLFGVATILVFGTAYAVGHVEKKRREKEAALDAAEDDAELRVLEEDAKAAKRELVEEEEEGEEEAYKTPPGSAACPHCHSVYLDADEAAACCPAKRGYEDDDEEPTLSQDFETGEIVDPEEEEEEPEGAEDLWPTMP